MKTDFFERFTAEDKKNDFFFNKINNEKYNFDLRGFINKEILD